VNTYHFKIIILFFIIYLLKKVIFFVLFVSQVDISHTMARPVPLFIPLESPQWVGVYQDGFLMFRLPMQELLNIGHFYYWKFNKIKSNSLEKLEALLTLLGKKSTMTRILWRWFFIFKTQGGVDIWFWVVFMNGNSTKLQIFILKGKNS